MTKCFIVGSNAFFKCYDDFKANDTDTLILEDEPKDYQIQQQIRLNGNCYFKWKRLTPQEYIDYHKNSKSGILLGKFLVPEFCQEIGFTIEDLKKLSFLCDMLKDSHLYEKEIYCSYLKNGSFTLTDEQRLKAYKLYKKHKK